LNESLRLSGDARVSGDPAHDRLAKMVADELAAERATRHTGPLRAAQARTEKRASGNADDTPAAVPVFAAFAPVMRVRWDGKFLVVESNGLPAHNLTVGITAWQRPSV